MDVQATTDSINQSMINDFQSINDFNSIAANMLDWLQ